jgi:hypothetical protein
MTINGWYPQMEGLWHWLFPSRNHAAETKRLAFSSVAHVSAQESDDSVSVGKIWLGKLVRCSFRRYVNMSLI